VKILRNKSYILYCFFAILALGSVGASLPSSDNEACETLANSITPAHDKIYSLVWDSPERKIAIEALPSLLDLYRTMDCSPSLLRKEIHKYQK
jgi:hypothetical protein